MKENSGELFCKNFKRALDNAEITAAAGRKQSPNQCSLLWTLQPNEKGPRAKPDKLRGGLHGRLRNLET